MLITLGKTALWFCLCCCTRAGGVAAGAIAAVAIDRCYRAASVVGGQALRGRLTESAQGFACRPAEALR
jgi:hypothetical protein